MREKYKIKLETSKGIEEGMLEISKLGGSISGEIISKIANTTFSDGVLKDNTLIFSGKIKVKFISVNYSAKCIIDGENLNGVVKTKFGDFKVSGKKISD